MDFNSTKNQHIKSQFVDKHVHACMTGIVEYVLTASHTVEDAPFTHNELDNSYYYEDRSGEQYTPDEREEKLDELRQELDETDSEELVDQLTEAIEYLEEADEQYHEIYEWWLVSRFLARKLGDYGQTILEDGMNHYWGRATTGQAILLDHVISKICEDMEILEGQDAEWN